jgi:competence transcription factor ComK
VSKSITTKMPLKQDYDLTLVKFDVLHNNALNKCPFVHVLFRVSNHNGYFRMLTNYLLKKNSTYIKIGLCVVKIFITHTVNDIIIFPTVSYTRDECSQNISVIRFNSRN